MLDVGRPVATVSEALGLVLDEANLGLAKYMAYEQPNYWGLLPSVQSAYRCRELNAMLYSGGKVLQFWLLRTYCVAYSLSGLTDLWHRLCFTYKLTTLIVLSG